MSAINNIISKNFKKYFDYFIFKILQLKLLNMIYNLYL